MKLITETDRPLFTETEKLVFDCILPILKDSNLEYKKIQKLTKNYHVVFILYISIGLEQDEALELIKLAIDADSTSKTKLDKKEMEYAGSKAFDLIKSINQDPEYMSGLLKNFINAYCAIRSDSNFGDEEAFRISIFDSVKINFDSKTGQIS